ncbi:MAG: ribonuclease [Proteobacteria bacterium]|nr:ribonuclease [Pseudomonadota bacterium]
MKRMLFNATHSEELRVAIVDGQKLIDLDIESSTYQQKKGNIYKARITRVEPSLEAAFVDYGSERQGFLPLKEISRIYFKDYDQKTPMGQVMIKDVIKEGQELIVQVEKEERGTKGAALTTFVSLAGRYLVLMPNNPRGGGISRRIEGEERAEMREAMAQLNIPQDYSVIIRTAGIGRNAEELQWDLDYLTQLWEAISKASGERPAPFLIYQESNLVIRAIRDYLRSDIGEIMIDNPEIYERAQRFMQQVMPQTLGKLKLYQDETPLFSRYQIEHQIEAAFAREVRLESGGALVFDKTEALVTIDVNSARATKGADIEETAFNTNLEAADEVARQLRLRDLGGLIVIDFIDMTPARNQREVENRLTEALKVDRARVQVGRISRFGLLEMSRQRLRPSLGESSAIVCPRCEGRGHIRTVQSLALHVLRSVQEEAMKENTAALHVHLPVDTATFLLNEKRYEINAIETRLGTPVLIIPDPTMETPHYHVRRLRSEEYDEEIDIPSYEVELVEEEEEEPRHHGNRPVALPQAEKAAVQSIAHTAPPPPTPAKAEAGFFSRLLKSLFGTSKAAAETKMPSAPGRPPRPPQHARGPHPQRRPDNREHRGPRPPHRGNQQPRPQHPVRAEGRPEVRPQPPVRPEARPPVPSASTERPQQAPVAKEPSDRPERPEGAPTGRRRRRGRRGRGAGRPQEGSGQRPEGQMNVAPPHAETHLPEVERGNEALPSLPPNEHRFEEQPQERVERLAAPESIVHEQPVAVPVQASSSAPVESVAVQAEPHPVATEPKNQ